MSNAVDKSSDIDSVYRKSKSSRGGGGGRMNECGEEVFWAAGTIHNAWFQNQRKPTQDQPTNRNEYGECHQILLVDCRVNLENLWQLTFKF